MPNHLADETSPYLLQHVNNPVDWHPWGPEALKLAKDQSKPIFLSVGYSACHWCHVMEHESFENEEIAKIINENFVAIKVDREERPDIDQIYMNAVQMMTGRGGWPMSVFLTPDLKPFYAGTYFPPKRSRGMPGFDEVLRAVNDAWNNRREQAEEMADNLTEQLNKLDETEAGDLDKSLVAGAAASMERRFDSTWGGFGSAPKFPNSMNLQLLLRHWFRSGQESSLNMTLVTLDRMAAGGIYDHLGGGFARYSVDERWLVPHFEKMLYDNALLALAYLEAYQAVGDANYRRVVQETLDYVLRDMTDEQGGFYSTEDADSEGEEGKFYVWTPDELREVLGAEAATTFARVYDVSEAGNFEGHSILNLPKTISQAAKVLGRDAQQLAEELGNSRAKLFEAREKRVHPGKDDKVIASWNGLMIEAMARAGAVLDEARYLRAAKQAADFLLDKMRRPDGRILHTWRNGVAKLDAYLDDYAAVTGALVTLFETSFDQQRIDQAVGLADLMIKHFADPDGGAFFYTADDHEQLIARSKDSADSAIPSGNSLAACALLRLAKLTGNAAYDEAAVGIMESTVALMQRAPTAAGQMLMGVDFHLGPTYEVVMAGEPGGQETQAAVDKLQKRFLPNKVSAFAAGDDPLPALAGLLAGKATEGDSPTLYVCENFTCQEPAEGGDAIAAALDQLSARKGGPLKLD